MEGVSATVYRGIKAYWRRKGYQRLNADAPRRKPRAIELASKTFRKRRPFWRIKLTPRLKLKLRFSPKKLLLGLRDAYVNLMVRIANTRVVGGGVRGLGMGAFTDYDERVIMEIYKSVVTARGQLVHRNAASFGTEIICRH